MEAIPINFKSTNILIIVLVLFHSVTPGKTVCNHENGCKLILAHILCRHGDRNPYQSYPTDPWRSEKYWPGGFGQLTKVGQQQEYNLGQYLRKRYARLFQNDKSAADGIYVESTDIPRVVKSARANLAGFFSSSKIDSKDIPIHVIPSKDDYTLTVGKQCNRFEYLQTKYEKTPAYTKLFDNNQAFLKSLERKSELKLGSLTNITNFYDTLFVERLKNFRLPSWAEDVMNDSQLKYLALKFYDIFTPTTEMKKLQSGYLLKEILSHFSERVSKISSANSMLWIYFAHDSSIANMLNSLGVFKLREIPPYSSCLFFELYENESLPFVKVFYRNTTISDVPPLEIPNCGTKCLLTKFYKLYDDILPKRSFNEECSLRKGERLPPGGNPESTFL